MQDKKFSGMDEFERQAALLEIAQSQSKRARLALARLEADAINDMAILSLRTALLAAKDISGLTWSNLTDKLHNPCSSEMLQKIAFRAKNPSPKTFQKIKQALQNWDSISKMGLPEIGNLKEVE